jgi:hypothetical protein
MSQFKYQLPSGAIFLVDAPPDTTQAQADFVFYSQVAAGTFVGYSAGQSLTSVATRLAEFNLSRLERDTAGVENATVLSIVQQSPVVAPIPNLTDIPLQDPITQADLAQIDLNAVPDIGPLPAEQVAALIAQIKNLPRPTTVTPFGFTCTQLERAGVFKPGVCQRDTFECNLSSPEAWTGLYGINSYNDLINNSSAQIAIQASLLNQAYDSLTNAGIIQQSPTAAVSLSTGEVWTNAGGLVEATANGILTGKVKEGSSFYNQVFGRLRAGAGVVSGLRGQLGSITSGLGAVTNLGTNVQGIANKLVNTNLSSLAGGGVSVLKNTINGGLNSITNNVAGSVGALMTNANQFGTAVTGLWAGGGLNNISTLAGGLSNNLTAGLSNLSGLTSGAVGNLNNLIAGGGIGGAITGQIGALTGQIGALTGQFGSIGGALTGQLNSLSGLASSTLGSLTGAASGALGSVTNLVSGTLGNLGTTAQNALGSLTGGLDLAGKMSSFSIDFSVFSSSGLASTVQKAPAFADTVNRATTDNAVAKILGNPKIPVPSFETPPSAITAGAQLDINFAKNILQTITSPVSGLLTQGQQVLNQGRQLAGTVTTAFNRLTG